LADPLKLFLGIDQLQGLLMGLVNPLQICLFAILFGFLGSQPIVFFYMPLETPAIVSIFSRHFH
jgi:hypothetical protein